jgi:DNA-binding NtrC family response regulator
MADVLIIDDDIDSAQVLAQIMEVQGHDVRVAYNGQEGLQLAADRTPQLALLDVEMPLLDGPGMAFEMLLHDMGLEQVPVIFLSGIPNLSAIAGRVGTPYFLSKPYGYRKVVALVERALAERIAPNWPEQSTAP